jgi:hypothetical protein
MPKNPHNIKKIIKESLGELEWMKKTNVDLIKLGSVFMDNEDERFVIDSISPYGLTIKSLDFPKDKEDYTIRKNWRKEDWLKLIDDGDIRWSHNKDLNESDELDWIKDIEPTNFDFSFDGEEYWVDVSKIDKEGRRKIVNYIKKTVPDYEEFEDDMFGHISRGNYKGIVIHCGSDRTDFEPEENLLCSANSSYEYDYEVENPYSDISKSIYIDGQEILDYLTVIGDEEELDESLEWSDKDAPFDEKDKSFESDPSWKNDEDWALNPERSYWKQGDAGGSGGGDMNESDDFEWIKNVKPDPLIASPDVFFRDDDDMFYTLDQLGHDTTNMTEMTMAELAINYGYRWSEKHEGWYHRDEVADFAKGNFPKGVRRGLDESDDFEWIKNVPDTIPSRENRNKIPLKDFLVDVMKGDLDLLHQLYSEYDIAATQEYMQTGNGGEAFTNDDWDEFGYDEWVGDGHWVDNHRWMEDPAIWQHETRESMELTDGVWKMVEWDTKEYNLERGTHQDRMVFKRKSDGAYFALDFSGSHYDGIEDWDEELYQVFPKQITRFIYESNKKIMFEGDMSWIEDIEPHKNYKGHPQGIVLLHNHQEIDEFCDIIDNYNGGRTGSSNRAAGDLHHGLENRRNELAEMSAEDDEDYGEAMLSVSFFVEKRRPNKLTIGYWPYNVSEDEMYISDWLDGGFTFNKEYQIYENINQLKTTFKNYKNPVL